MKYAELANLLFPYIDKKPEDFEKKYPRRSLGPEAKITRLGPSPTGFIHLGNLYGAFVDERLAAQSEGLFYLRIEDTDDKRFVEGAVESIIDALSFFDIDFDEGAGKDGERGDYGPYHQSKRVEIYQTFVKYLVAQGMAYPCFMTEEEIGRLREQQEKNKLTPGIYGEFAKYRDASWEEINKNIEGKKPYVIRLKSSGNPKEPAPISIEDGIRGILTIPENYQDIVILKQGGMPTYHFAHVVDDHLMRTSHVVRGEEWLSSLSVHVELFKKLDFELPIYCHTAVLMKLDENGNKRKLSKRKDPELSLDFYKEQGYHPTAVREYLLTLLNSNFEEWRKENPLVDAKEFPFSMAKMSTSGALFDLNKLNDVSKDVLVNIEANKLGEFVLKWARTYAPEKYEILEKNKDRLPSILGIGRSGDKPRKDLVCGSQIFDFIDYFFDETFEIQESMPIEISPDSEKSILQLYLDKYCHDDNQSQWFDKVREIAINEGYAAKPKDYKKNPQDYKGHVGHVSTVIRIAIVGKSQSPDLWEIQQILGEEKVRERVKTLISNIG